MRTKRLVWQIFPTFLLVSVAALFASGWFAARSFEQFFLTRVRDELRVRDQLVAREAAALLAQGRRQELAALVNRHAEETAARYTVIRADGSVAFDTEQAAETMDNHAGRDEVQEALSRGFGASTRYSSTLHERMMYGATALTHDGRTIGVVRTAVPVSSIDEAIAQVRNRFIAGSVIVALATALVSWFLARRITRPIEEMRHGAERFARGDLDYKLPLGESVEMAGLANSLNVMAEQLEERIGTILRQSSEQNAVLASMVEGVLAVDPHERIITLNSAAAGLLECNRQRALGRPARDFVLNPELRQFVSQAVTCDEPIQQDINLSPDGQRVIQARGTALGEPGQRRGAVIVLNDVTNIRRLENLRRDFVANVSHELKTPITSIKGFVETMLDGALDNRADAERFLAIVGKQADRLAAIVDDLLSLAKIEQSEAELDLHETDLREVAQGAIQACQGLAKERRVRVRFEAPSAVMARVNPPLLEQAVANLLDNALKYSGADAEVVISLAATPTEATIAVADSGVGIAAEHLPRLFERFYRVDKARSRKVGGTGLGLAIVKHIASAHRGRVAVASQPGSGSTFTIHLPRAIA